jgi:hypothetical protein
VRADAGTVAVEFTGADLESFSHLFRLIQSNAPDPESIEQELGVSAFLPQPTSGIRRGKRSAFSYKGT